LEDAVGRETGLAGEGVIDEIEIDVGGEFAVVLSEISEEDVILAP
jgi:hypothetical protein